MLDFLRFKDKLMDKLLRWEIFRHRYVLSIYLHLKFNQTRKNNRELNTHRKERFRILRTRR